MIYFSSHKFAFSNLRFSPFYEHFRQLREKYTFKLRIKYIMVISSLSPIWWCTYISLFPKKPLYLLHPLHWTIQNILLDPNPFHCFFAKSLRAGKKIFILPSTNYATPINNSPLQPYELQYSFIKWVNKIASSIKQYLHCLFESVTTTNTAIIIAVL